MSPEALDEKIDQLFPGCMKGTQKITRMSKEN